MSRFWSDVVSKLSPYVPGEQPSNPEVIKLNTNESAFSPSERVIEAIEAGARTGKIGDGKVFVYDLEQVVRIRTGETGAEAL